jgi:hypothetical protein
MDSSQIQALSAVVQTILNDRAWWCDMELQQVWPIDLVSSG